MTKAKISYKTHHREHRGAIGNMKAIKEMAIKDTHQLTLPVMANNKGKP